MTKSQIAQAIALKFIELGFEFNYRTDLNTTISSDEMGTLIITDNQVEFEECDELATINSQSDLDDLLAGWDD